MKGFFTVFIILIILFNPLYAEVPSGKYVDGDRILPSHKKDKKFQDFPGDQVFSKLPDKITDTNKKEIREKLEATLQEKTNLPASQVKVEKEIKRRKKKPAKKRSGPKTRQKKITKVKKSPKKLFKAKNGVKVYYRNIEIAEKLEKQAEYISLPSTSIVLATTLYGIEAVPTKERPALAELNYVWLGPNKAVVEMTNCRIWLDVRGDYTTERVMGDAKELSCRSPGGETFDIPLHAYMIDEKEEYLGARGVVVAKGKAMASALEFLQNGVSAFGKAMGAAQVTTKVTTNENSSSKDSNITGNPYKYMGGESISGSTAKFLNWWISYYQSLQPTVAIGPGKKVYLAIRGSVKVPMIFFGKKGRKIRSFRDFYNRYHKVNTTSIINRKGKR